MADSIYHLKLGAETLEVLETLLAQIQDFDTDLGNLDLSDFVAQKEAALTAIQTAKAEVLAAQAIVETAQSDITTKKADFDTKKAEFDAYYATLDAIRATIATLNEQAIAANQSTSELSTAFNNDYAAFTVSYANFTAAMSEFEGRLVNAQSFWANFESDYARLQALKTDLQTLISEQTFIDDVNVSEAKSFSSSKTTDLISAEATARESADTTLQNNIAAEAAARENADSYKANATIAGVTDLWVGDDGITYANVSNNSQFTSINALQTFILTNKISYNRLSILLDGDNYTEPSERENPFTLNNVTITISGTVVSTQTTNWLKINSANVIVSGGTIDSQGACLYISGYATNVCVQNITLKAVGQYYAIVAAQSSKLFLNKVVFESCTPPNTITVMQSSQLRVREVTFSNCTPTGHNFNIAGGSIVQAHDSETIDANVSPISGSSVYLG